MLNAHTMIVSSYSYRFAEEVLKHQLLEPALSEILKICKDCPLPLYKGKSKKQKGKEVIQQIMNTYFRLRFEELEWTSEPFASPESTDDSLRADFRKEFADASDKFAVQIEVEFGNAASIYRDYFKFQLSYWARKATVWVLIVPTYKLANRIDGGVANFEKIHRELPSALLSVTVPILAIGLDEDPANIWDLHDEKEAIEKLLNKNGGSEITADEMLNVLKNNAKRYSDAHEQLVQLRIDATK